MRSIRAAVAAAVLIIPGVAFAATSEPSATHEKSTAEQVRPVSRTAQQPARETESDSFAQVPAAAPLASSKPKTVRRAKLRVARTAAAPPFNGGCARYWC